MRTLSLLLLSAVAVGAGRQAGEPESPLSILHILRLPVFLDYSLSPGGKRVAATASFLGKQGIWLIASRDEPGEQLAPSEGQDGDPDWSPDGRSIVFASNRAGGWHLFIATPGATEARQITRHPGEDRSPRWSPDGRHIAYLSRRLGSETGWDLWTTSADSRGKAKRRTQDPLNEEDPRWSPDGKWIAYTYRAGRHVDRRIALVSPETGETRQVLPEGWEGDSHSPRWSSDGRQLAFVSDHGGRKTIFTVLAQGGEPKPVVRSRYEETDPAWSPDGHELVHVSNREGNLKLMVTSLTDRKSRFLTPGSGVYRSPRWTPDGEAVACLYEGPTYPRDVWIFKKQGGRQRLTESLFADLDVRQMIRPELVRYSAFDGRTITGFLYLPPKASAEAPVPLVVHPHGGPTSQWQNGWHPYVQFLAQQGLAVFAPNVRGSAGSGLEFENLNDRDWGKGDLDDLVVGTREMARRPEIRGDRLGIWGVSYGGFLTLAAIGRYPDLFTCAVEAVGMPDLEKLYRETNTEGRSYLEREIGPLRGSLALYRELSPARHADQMDTPLLSFHAADYPLVPYSTKKPFIDALRSRPPYPLLEFVFKGKRGPATYRFDRYPAASRFYMEKILEFFEIYL